jgi:adenylate cyclase
MTAARILIVDDEPDLEALIQQKFRHQIRDDSVSFLFARDGVEALAVLKANRDVDMVVADINMPRMDGLSLLRKLQENEEKLSTIIVSAYGDMANIRLAMNRGAFDFLTKPIDFLDLETTIAKTIRHVRILRYLAEGQRATARMYVKCTAVRFAVHVPFGDRYSKLKGSGADGASGQSRAKLRLRR